MPRHGSIRQCGTLALVTDNSGRLVRGKLWFDDGFTMVPNTWLRDRRLSYGARGLLAYLASHDDKFELSIRGVAAASIQGVDAVRTLVGELEREGYLKRYRLRDGTKIAGVAWHLVDPFMPVDNPHQPTLDGELLPKPRNPRNRRSEPESGFPTPGIPTPGIPTPENPTTIEDHLQEETSPETRNVTTGRAREDRCPNGHAITIADRWCVYACPPADASLASDEDVDAALGRQLA